jgi:hypothetical protein
MSTTDESRLERLATYGLSPEDTEEEDLHVGEGEVVSTADESTTTVQVESVAHLREMIGVSGEDALPLRSEHTPDYVPTMEELTAAMRADTQPPGSPDEALQSCIDCLLFRGGGSGSVDDGRTSTGEIRATLDRWEQHVDTLITEEAIQTAVEVFLRQDITVSDGGRFRVDPNTNVLLADTITIHGDGEITYQGHTKIDCHKTVGRP